MRKTRKRMVAAGLAVGLVVGGTAAYAYWTGGGSGTGTAQTASDVTSQIVVNQVSPLNTLRPGSEVALRGTLVNPSTTDIKVGTLTAEITGVSNGAAMSDFSLTGNPVAVDAVVKRGTPLAWSGMSLAYANSDLDQDAGKGATVTIQYTLSAFQGGTVVPPVVLPLGTSTVVTDPVTGAKVINVHIATMGSTTWNGTPYTYTLLPGDILQVMSYHGSVVYTDLATVGADGTVQYIGSPTADQVGAGSQSLQLAINSNGVTILGSGPGTMLSGYVAP